MLALRCGERALPLAWRVEETDGAIGFEPRKALLDAVAPWLPTRAKARLMGDRFYGTADLIGWCQEREWDYRLRLKGNLVVFDGIGVRRTESSKDRLLIDTSSSPAAGSTHTASSLSGHSSTGSSPFLKPVACAPLVADRWGIERCSRTSNRAVSHRGTQLRYADRLDA